MANILEVNRPNNKITLGTTGTTINVASHTASKILALNASKDLEVVTIGSSLDYTRPTLNTIQDIRTSASPQLAGIELGHASDTTITRVSAGIIAVEGTTVMLVGDAPTAHVHDGDTLQLDGINSNGGAFAFTTSGAVTFSQNIIIGDGKTIGQAAGPLLTFDDTNNYLEITGCKVGIGTATPSHELEVVGQITIPNNNAYRADDIGGTSRSLLYIDTSDNIIFGSSTLDEIHLICAENVGIGTITPRTKLTVEGALTLKEQAAADGDTAAYGQVWCKTAVPNELWFTNDIGTDLRITPQDLQISANPQFAGLGLGVAATTGTLVVRSLGADGEDIFVIERSTSDLLVFNYLDNAGTDSCALELKRGGTSLIYLSTRSTDDSYLNMAGGLVIGGTDAKTKLTIEGTLTLKEQAAADGDTAAYGQLWVKTATPNELWFTNDAGTDIQLKKAFTHYNSLTNAIFDDTSPTTYQDLDLSSIVGSNRALVFIRCWSSDRVVIYFRENGDTVPFSRTDPGINICDAANACQISIDNANAMGYAMIETDASGVIEWETNTAVAVKLYLACYIK